MITSGIYVIINTTNGKRYFGSSVNIKARMRKHRRRLNRGVHVNCHLQNSWNKYGESAFVFKTIVLCPREDLTKVEQEFLQTYMDYGYWKWLYNIAPHAENREMAQETKEKISASMSGRKKTAEHKKALSMSRRGEETSSSKLTEPEVLKIREKYSQGGITQREIAIEFGVHQTLISYIVRRKIWTHI